MKEFIAQLERPEGVGTWTYFNVPFDVEDAFGKKGQVKVKGTINGYPFRSSVMPHGDGTHYMVVNQSIRESIRVTPGDKVKVTMEIDIEPRTVSIPEDFQKLLDGNPSAKTKFDSFHTPIKKNGLTGLTKLREKRPGLKGFRKQSRSYLDSTPGSYCVKNCLCLKLGE